MTMARFGVDERPGAAVEVKVLNTWAQRLRGLLGTGPEAGPVVLTRCSSVHTFGMAYDLDVAFVDASGEIVEVVRALPPGRVVSSPSASCVFERPAAGGAWLEAGEHLWTSALWGEGAPHGEIGERDGKIIRQEDLPKVWAAALRGYDRVLRVPLRLHEKEQRPV
ncbi:DUF192 domain-containing protein [Paratractidigestivibacter sp.]|uniref:DUF192 domain-containing protein n=2 Tax=Paratractidigestivibacter sp. TaxID=2847316 RepID=UPI002AC8991A|nr:DUF192 domain-containing protein [Paratractidigestivibacter sp.]